MRFAAALLLATCGPAAAWANSEGDLPLQTMTMDEIMKARAAGTGCAWSSGSGRTVRVAMKKDRGAVKRDGRIIALRPAADAKEAFPYTYHRWTGGGMLISIRDSGRRIEQGYEHVETVAKLTLTENGRSRSWRGRLSCGS